MKTPSPTKNNILKMKTPSPTKNNAGTRSPHGRLSPHGSLSPERKVRRDMVKPTLLSGPPTPNTDTEHKLKVLGHSMISRSGDQESEMAGLNVDLRLITSRMAQTMRTYEGKQASLVKSQIEDVEGQLGEISNPILQLQIKTVLEDYKDMAGERESILHNLENWFTSCSDEFLEEVLEFETHFEGEDTLSEHLSHAKDVIAKIHFINKRILEFQNNGMSTKKLVAQKKTLEEELLKKKVIVDNTAKGSEAYSTWQFNATNLSTLIKESSANDVDKAIIELKLSEASDHVSNQLISLERTSRRIGVLFKSVKELEQSNAQLAEENSYLKCRLSKIDKHFGNVMAKKVQKLNDINTDIKDVKHLKTVGPGMTPDAINMSIKTGGGMSLEMEMIDNYQQSIHTLDSENKSLIAKMDKLEDEIDEQKEEIITLNQKLKMEESYRTRRSRSASSSSGSVNLISIEHPLVKLDDGDDMSDTKETGNKSNTLKTMSHRLNDGTGRRCSSIVSSITIQDGNMIENLKSENEMLRGTIYKLKSSLTNLRKQTAHSPKNLDKMTQTKPPSKEPPKPPVLQVNLKHETDQAESEFVESDVDTPPQNEVKKPKKRKIMSRTPRLKKKKIKGRKVEKDAPVEEAEEAVYSSLDEDVEIELPPEEGSDQERQQSDHAVSLVAADLKKFVEKSDRKEKRANRRKEKAEIEAARKCVAESVGNHDEETDIKSETSSSESEIDYDGNEKLRAAEEAARNSKAVPPPKKKKKKQKVKFMAHPEEPKPDVPEPPPETPQFQRMPTPKVTEPEDPIVMLGKIKSEIKAFLSYGNKFIGDIHNCILGAADHDLAMNIDYYAEMEQKIQGLEASLNILLYGIDLGMSLATPPTERPPYSPIPFENKLYFQENLSKYLRAKYPQLNVNAMRLFDADLDPVKELTMKDGHIQGPVSPPYNTPYPEYAGQHGFFTNHLHPLTNTPEPYFRQPPKKIRKRKQLRQLRKVETVGKLEEIMQSLTSGAIMDSAKASPYLANNTKIMDDRSFTEIVDRVMPKEIAMEYLKLVQPTQDTFGKRQYNEKLKRGVLKVKDLLDLVNMNPNTAVMKGLPTNKLGEPRSRQTKVHKNNMEMVAMGLVKTQQTSHLYGTPYLDNYRNRMVTSDERVRASLDDYDETSVSSSNSLTVFEVPLSSRVGLDVRKAKSDRRMGERSGTKEDMFDLAKSNPNMDKNCAPDKRSFLPVVTQNLLPHSETKRFPSRSKKLKKIVNQPPAIGDNTPKVSDILNMGWTKTTPKLGGSSIDKLPSINNTKVEENSSFP